MDRQAGSTAPVQPSCGVSTGDSGGPGAGRREAPPASGLPRLSRLSRNNSTKEEEPSRVNVLTGGHKRIAHVLYTEIMALVERFGIERLGLLTLTFADNVQTVKEARRRFNSLATHVLRSRYERAIVVLERQKSGRIHFHLLAVLASDIRTGLNFEEVRQRNYRSACPQLRAEWKFWRETAPEYGFGSDRATARQVEQRGDCALRGQVYFQAHRPARATRQRSKIG